MSESATKLLIEAMALAPDERFQLAHELLESVDGYEDVTDDPEFQAELTRRLEAISNGTAELIPWEQARENIRAELERFRLAREQEGKS